jgi:tetratricopeptide (TPR) repeat protein
MMRLVRLFRCMLAVLLCASFGGCLPSGQSVLDEQREPHFVAGKNRVSGMDYRGAIESFEKTLEANPHSASAHFELAWLYHEKEANPAAAIYHYQRFLKLRPNAENADIIRQRIYVCKQDLAKGVLPLPTTPGMQREFEQLIEENKRLRDEVEKWRVYAVHLQTLTNPPPQQAAQPRAPAPATTGGTAVHSTMTAAERQPATAAVRTHSVREGETLSSIARKYGVRLDALTAANPRLDPHRIQIGQTINIPSP